MLGVMGMMLSGSRQRQPNQREIKPTETDEEKSTRLERFKIERYKANGLKQFKFGDNVIYALNLKNAKRKAINNAWI